MSLPHSDAMDSGEGHAVFGKYCYIILFATIFIYE